MACSAAPSSSMSYTRSKRRAGKSSSKSMFSNITNSVRDAFSVPKFSSESFDSQLCKNMNRAAPKMQNINTMKSMCESLDMAQESSDEEECAAAPVYRMERCAAPSFGSGFAPPQPNPTCMPYSATHNSASQHIPQFSMSADSAPATNSTPSKPIANNYQTITNAQDPSGYWTSIVSIDLEPASGKLISDKLSDEKVSATVYALILLLSKFGSQYNEWKLTAIKGVSFLKSKFGENVVDKFNEIVAEVGASVDDDLVDELFE